MSYKRSRATFEADDHAPYALFGTPLPEEGRRDDGAYLPLWKQDVRDDKGRRRLHGAFTGGWSAGYFNTVGSKEGWTPSTFVSSRSDRRKDGSGFQQQRAEDFMDEEDLADATEAQTLKTSQAFSGLGFSTQEEMRAGGLMGLLRAKGDTMGLRLLRKMGWKDGQGIGPKVRRAPRLELGGGGGGGAPASTETNTFLFAPENTEMIQFIGKTDRRGLGGLGGRGAGAGAGAKLFSTGQSGRGDDDEHEDEDEYQARTARGMLLGSARSRAKAQKGGFGVGVLNDTGSDEEDPYEMGPKIKYNRIMGGDKKKKKDRAMATSTSTTTTSTKKKASAAVNPSLKTAPVFTLKRTSALGGYSLRRCHDGRLPLDGFILARAAQDPLAVLTQYAPPPVPPGWRSCKSLEVQGGMKTEYVSTADAARASTHDARSRAAVLGEKALPGKSVFDYISALGRDKIAAASGRADLPPARGEVPEEARVSEEERQRRLWEQVPRLDRETAVAAIARGSRGPYADDEAKKLRYRQFLEYFAAAQTQVQVQGHGHGHGQAQSARAQAQTLPEKRRGVSDEDFLREMNEFYNCARIFKPMTGFMASRFTTAKAPSTTASPVGRGEEASASASASAGAAHDAGQLAQKRAEKPADPAEEAARLGMFGTMTRSVHDFYPTRLLCKRFNVKAPAHVSGSRHEEDKEKEEEGEMSREKKGSCSAAFGAWESGAWGSASASVSVSASGTAGKGAAARDAAGFTGRQGGGYAADEGRAKGGLEVEEGDESEMRADEDKAVVDGAAASADLLRAVFGDSEDDDDDDEDG